MSDFGDTPVPFGAQPRASISTPPSADVEWIVYARSNPSRRRRVTARTAWLAHLAAKLGPFSEVECTQVEAKNG